MPGVYVDSNIIIRFLLQEDSEQFARAKALMQRASDGEIELLLSPVIVGEVAAVLHHSYDMSQRAVATALLTLVAARGVKTEDEALVIEALQKSRNLLDIDFVDAYVALEAKTNHSPIASFDRGLHKKLGTLVFDF